jgi:cytochrome c oxidase cbb3-type subunit 3
MLEGASLMQKQMPARWLAMLCGVCAVAACQRSAGESSDTAGPTATSTPAVSSEQSATSHLLVAADSLRFIEHPEILPAGFPSRLKPLLVQNPYEGDKRAISVGGQLFVGYNCVDCHGAEGSGAMAPSFQDGRWHFGGSPGEVFESIYQGRPDGMPSWGGRISNDQIWMLTAYVRSLSKKDLSTEDFTGRTVERSGH